MRVGVVATKAAKAVATEAVVESVAAEVVGAAAWAACAASA